jgi:uncharacterized phage-associated protein
MDTTVPDRAAAPTMGNIARISYTHDAMIDQLVANPGISQAHLALMFGYSQSWISNIMASDLFKDKLAARRAECVDPVLHNTVKENMEGIVRRSQEVLMEKLEKPGVSDATVLKAMELGARSLGMGGMAAAPTVPGDHLAALANRLIDLQQKVINPKGSTYEGEASAV